MTKTETALRNALMVLLNDNVILQHLRANDPNALQQAQAAADQSERWIAQATRRNVDGKPDYVWTLRYSNGKPCLYTSEAGAYLAAARACADTAHGLHTPRATLACI
jgi:hypothetical protein